MKHILVAVIAVILAGCASEEHSDLRAWMADASKDLRGKVPPLPQVKPYEPVPYDVGNLLDPFKPGKIIGAEKGYVRIWIVRKNRWKPILWSR